MTGCPHSTNAPCLTCNGQVSGRPPAEIIVVTPELAELIRRLRELHAQNGVTRRELAAAIFCSESTLSRDLSGARCPTWKQTRAIVRACDDERHMILWQRRWEQAQASLFPTRLPDRFLAAMIHSTRWERLRHFVRYVAPYVIRWLAIDVVERLKTAARWVHSAATSTFARLRNQR
ncbi:helix-turn-helix domain-containing protein [Streptomyces sp. NPDC058622]|uniref:helix-turn-helix domain-containing protein n=1 Tax=Streptomyces sp. NPDC058622 TaxID=3346562 RepID=UPI00364AC643